MYVHASIELHVRKQTYCNSFAEQTFADGEQLCSLHTCICTAFETLAPDVAFTGESRFHGSIAAAC
jgi:hypothetical protein